jgi:hypothetical protein
MEKTQVELLAKEAGLEKRAKTVIWSGRIESLISFAERVAQEEAKDCEEIVRPISPAIADLIRFKHGLS